MIDPRDLESLESWEREAYELGLDWGAEFVEIDETEANVPQYLDREGKIEFLTQVAFEAEENARQFESFCHIAAALDEMDYPEDAWDMFEEGVTDAIREGIAARFAE